MPFLRLIISSCSEVPLCQQSSTLRTFGLKTTAFEMYIYFCFAFICLIQNCIANESKNRILSYSSTKSAEGYHFRFDSSDGIHRDETATIVPKGEEDSVLQVFGEYSYHLPNGQYHLVRYRAGEEGFKPEVYFRYAKIKDAAINNNDNKNTFKVNNNRYLKVPQSVRNPTKNTQIKFKRVLNIRQSASRQKINHYQKNIAISTSTAASVLRKQVFIKRIGLHKEWDFINNTSLKQPMESNKNGTSLEDARSTSSITTSQPWITLFPTFSPITAGQSFENITLPPLPPLPPQGLPPPPLEINTSAIGSLAGGGLG